MAHTGGSVLMAQVVPPTRRSRNLGENRDEGRRIEAVVRRCLASFGEPWAARVDPSGSLAHWWVLTLTRPEDGLQSQAFVDASREIEAEVCRRLVRALRVHRSSVQCGTAAPPCGEPLAPPHTSPLQMRVDASVPSELRQRFEDALSCAFESRPGVFRVRMLLGRNPDEVLVLVTSSGRRAPFPLFFPRAHSLQPADVFRIVCNVLEGMGPGFA